MPSKVIGGMSAIGKDPGAQWTLLLVFTILLSFGFGFMVGTRFSIPAPNTATQTVPCGTYSGFLANLGTTTAGGLFPQQSGENEVGNGIAAAPGEIFEKTIYRYSWTDDGQGEAVIVEGRILGCGIVGGWTTGARYAFFISSDGGQHWDPFKQSDLGGTDGNELEYTGASNPGVGTYVCAPGQNSQWCITQGQAKMPTGIMRIHGVNYLDAKGASKPIIDGAWLKVVIQVQANQWFDMAYDIAQLKSAMPTVQWTQDLYQIGQVATVRVDVPITQTTDSQGNHTAYFLTVLNMNDNSVVGSYSSAPITQLHSQVGFTVTAAMFQPGNINRLRAEVDSQIFRAQMQDTATIDNTSLAPTLKSVTWNQPFYREGELVVINVTAEPNGVTHSAIAKYYLLAHVGGIKYYDEFIAGASGNSATAQFTAANAGALTVEVTAIDTAGRSSAVGRYTVNVGAAIGVCTQYPNLPECTGGNRGLFDWGIVILVFLLFIGIGVFFWAARSKGNPGWRIPAVIVSLALVAVTVIILAPIAVNAIATALTPHLAILLRWFE